MKIKLKKIGKFICFLDIPELDPLPFVIVWGESGFLYIGLEEDVPVYLQAFTHIMK